MRSLKEMITRGRTREGQLEGSYFYKGPFKPVLVRLDLLTKKEEERIMEANKVKVEARELWNVLFKYKTASHGTVTVPAIAEDHARSIAEYLIKDVDEGVIVEIYKFKDVKEFVENTPNEQLDLIYKAGDEVEKQRTQELEFEDVEPKKESVH